MSKHSGFDDSEIVTFTPAYYSDDTHAIISEEGLLENAFEWAGESKNDFESYAVSGKLNADDYAFLRTMNGLKHLNLAEVTSEAIPDKAFAGTRIVSVNMPQMTSSYGKELFSASSTLCAISLNSAAKPANNVFDGFKNPNLLCYLSDAYQKTNGASVADVDWITNIVNASGGASSLTLNDGYPFNAPKGFNAVTAKYVKNFSKETAIGGSQGWESLSLPFDVQEVNQGVYALKPFMTYTSQEGIKPFWLYTPDGSSWEKCDRINANTPYIISMPNNPGYAPQFNTSGNVTFSSRSVTVNATPEAEGFMYYSGCTVWPNFSILSKDLGIYAINDGWHDGEAPGSVFVKGEHDMRPFECYATSDSSPKALPIFGRSEVDGIEDLFEDIRIWSEGRDILIDSPYDAVLPVYDPAGRQVRMVVVKSGGILREPGFIPGVYLIGNHKILVKN